jgi:hypothetical protein
VGRAQAFDFLFGPPQSRLQIVRPRPRVQPAESFFFGVLFALRLLCGADLGHCRKQ